MAFDVNNQYTGKYYGAYPNMGHTTPDLELSDVLRPWLPVAYPAPYLPGLRQDFGHPKLANIVLSSQHLVGLDSSGALVPAGLFCGTQNRLGTSASTTASVTSDVATVEATNDYKVGDVVNISGITGTFAFLNGSQTVTSATGSQYSFDVTHADVASGAAVGASNLSTAGKFCILVYGPNDVGFSYNAQTGAYVQSAGEHAVLAAPSDAVAGNVTLPDGTTVVVSSDDITFANSCTLFDTGVAKPIGVATRNVYQYIGGVTVLNNTGGMNYTLNGVVPTSFIISNYMHEMGTAIQTQYVIRLPWVGVNRYSLTADATTDGVTGYSQGYGLSFAHFTGTPLKGQAVVGSSSLQDYGNYSCFVEGVNSPSDSIGRVIGVMNMINKIGYSNRVRTLWDDSRIVNVPGAPNPGGSTQAMGGSATGGIDYCLSLTTDGLYKKALTQGKQIRPEYGTYVIVRINL
jgi:hypothetical protein